MSYSESLQARADAVARHRENRGRMAHTSTTVVTEGIGTVELPDRIDFGLTYIEKPAVHYGSECDANDLRDALGIGDNDALTLPQCSGSVTAWDVDDNGHYVGAWCTVAVGSTVSVRVTHHFSFMATAIKDIPHDPND